MPIAIVEDDPSRLAEYAQVSIGFTVADVFDDAAVAALLDGKDARAVTLASPYWKNYDEHPGCRPTDWPGTFDVSRWTFLSARMQGKRVGGAVMIKDAPEVELLRDCIDCALLWDLRVAPEVRSHGIGSALLAAAEDLAGHRGTQALRVETQQVNVAACRFYARSGFRLERAVRGAYDLLPHEIQLLWRKAL